MQVNADPSMSAPRGKTGGSMDPAALERTLQRRPDLLEHAALDDEARKLLGEIRAERAQRERVTIGVRET